MTQTDKQEIIQRTYQIFAVTISAWILAWMLKIRLDSEISWLTSSLGSFAYWVVAKLFIWILPALQLIKLSQRNIKTVFNLKNWKSWIVWGGGIGFLIALTGFIPNYLAGQPILPEQFSIALFSVLVIAPIFEELLMRGAIMGNLELGYSKVKANIVTSILFLILHLPGWYFMGNLLDNLALPVGGALSIFLVSLAFGYAAQRSKSVMAGIVAHFLNNIS